MPPTLPADRGLAAVVISGCVVFWNDLSNSVRNRAKIASPLHNEGGHDEILQKLKDSELPTTINVLELLFF